MGVGLAVGNPSDLGTLKIPVLRRHEQVAPLCVQHLDTGSLACLVNVLCQRNLSEDLLVDF